MKALNELNVRQVLEIVFGTGEVIDCLLLS